MFGCDRLLLRSLASIQPSVFTSSPKVVFLLEPQGSESESVNGPGRDSGLASSRLEPSATLPNRGGAESGPETMEGMLYRKQEMESHSKKAATRFVMSEFSQILERRRCRPIKLRGSDSVTSLISFFLQVLAERLLCLKKRKSRLL